MPRLSVYVDTTILGNWILYQQKRDKVAQAGERIIESYAILEKIEKGFVDYAFETSTWAISELAGIIVDNLLAEQMLRDGISLTEFSSQKRVFKIKEENTKRAIIENLATFTDYLEKVGFRIRSYEIDEDSVIDLLFKHTFLPIPDALHLSFAIRSCDVFLTLDQRHFLDKDHRKEIQDANKIRILRPYELLEIVK
jgi:hypothetical protein